MKTSDILKRNIPEFQQGSPALDAYLEAAGDFLDETKEAIVNLDYSRDYLNSSERQLVSSLNQRGYAVPARINERTKRRLLRDVSEIQRKNGTLDALVHAIRIAGMNPDIRVGWVFGPSQLRMGYKVSPLTLEEERYDITRFVYTDMLYGGEVVTDDGVFFEGYAYEDPFQENKLGPFPILGEQYEKTPETSIPVAKSPYLIVRFEDGNLNIVTDPVVDPDTGEVYEYTTSEQFELINDVLRYFLIENNRPTTVRIIVIVGMQPIEEEISIDDEFEDETRLLDDGGDTHTESISVFEDITTSGMSDVSGVVVGSIGIIGTPSPTGSRFSCVELSVDDYSSNAVLPEVYEWTSVVARTYQPDGVLSAIKIPMRGGTDITFVSPRDNRVFVKGFLHESNPTEYLVATVEFGSATYLEIPVEYQYVILEFMRPITKPFKLNVRYRGTTVDGPINEGHFLETESEISLASENGMPLRTETLIGYSLTTEDGIPLVNELGVDIYT